MTDHQFRTAAFGGFNRQDVLDYLTTSAEKTNEELEALRGAEEALRKELDELRQAHEALTAEHTDALRERDEYKNQAEQLTIEIARISTVEQEKGTEIEELRGQLTAAFEELELLRAQVEKLTPGAEAYDAIKDRTAGMELEAYRRAQSVEARARILAGDLQRQMEQWMAKVESQYADLKSEVTAGMSRAREQLALAGDSLDRVDRLMEVQSEAMRAMSESYAEGVKKK